MVVSAVRIQALRLVSSQDITYSKGYLGLLSVVGTFFSILAAQSFAPKNATVIASAAQADPAHSQDHSFGVTLPQNSLMPLKPEAALRWSEWSSRMTIDLGTPEQPKEFL